MSMMMDPNAMPHTHEVVAPGTPTAQQQEHPPVWDSHSEHHKWEYVGSMGGWIHDNDPGSLCRDVGAIPFQPTFGHAPPHPRCLVGECDCEWGRAARIRFGLGQR